MIHTTLFDSEAIQQALQRITESLCQNPQEAPWAVVGIRRGGDVMAGRLVSLMEQHTGVRPPRGVVDITLYRDDGMGPHAWPQVGASQLGFDLKAHTVVLVDDVLFTGRTVRAALDAVLDYGRPRAVRLAVLVDRGCRELPIQADAVGFQLQLPKQEHVDVQWASSGAVADAVVQTHRHSHKDVVVL
jgi:pyrimidine operon attenuation protein/uracil phosphoribosyltransferase